MLIKSIEKNIFRAHSVEMVEIEKGDLETGIETMDLGVFTKYVVLAQGVPARYTSLQIL